MADAPRFTAIFGATDAASQTLAEISKHLAAMRGQVAGLNRGTQAVTGQSAEWGRFASAVGGLEGAFGKANEGITTFATSLSGMFPALAALGGAFSGAEAFRWVEEVAEGQVKLQRTAGIIGTTSAELSKFNYIARRTDTDVGGMTKGFELFGKNVATARSGVNKEGARMFRALGVDIKQGRAFGAIMEDMFKAFRVNPNEQNREMIAKLLFGRGGIDLIPMLKMSHEELGKLFDEFDKVGFVADAKQALDLTEYHESWQRFTEAVSSLGKAIAADLAPSLTPFVQLMTNWLTTDRAAVAERMAEALKVAGAGMAVLGGIKSTEWAAGIIGGFKGIEGAALAAGAAEVAAVAGAAGGGALVLPGLKEALTGAPAAAKGAPAPGARFGFGAWLKGITDFAKADSLGFGYALAYPFTPEGAAEKARELEAIRRMRGQSPEQLRGLHQEGVPYAPESSGWWDWLFASPAPQMPDLTSSGPMLGGQQGHVQVDININGLPDNATVQTRSSGSAGVPNVTTDNTGPAFPHLRAWE